MESIVILSIVILIGYYLFNQKSNPKEKQRIKKVSVKPIFNQDTDLTDKELRDVDLDYKAKHSFCDKNPDAQNIPEIVKFGRKLHKGKTLYELSQKYYSTLPSFSEDKPQTNNELVKIIDNSLSLIEPFILCEKKTWNSFDIKKIPLIENALLYYTVYGNNDKVKETYKLVKHFPELSMYLPEAINSVKLCSILPSVLKHIKEKNGVKTTDLKNVFLEDYELIKSKMYYLGKLGILKVTKIGNSNFYQVI